MKLDVKIFRCQEITLLYHITISLGLYKIKEVNLEHFVLYKRNCYYLKKSKKYKLEEYFLELELFE